MIITAGLFLIMQIIFIAINGTFLEPNLNRMGNFASGIAENPFFYKWFILYDNPIFKLITTVGILHIIYVLIKTAVLGFKEKDTKPS
ncbi:YfzA family protein [Lentibacillus sp. L22]|uniref:YfzA family protein n=1 Tax=Lentibacillus sp. L22 TaxID=3163028 RepID=UPI003467BC52